MIPCVKDKFYPLTNPPTTIAEAMELIPPDEIEQLKAWGDVRDDARWGAGDMAMKWIEEYDIPVNLVLAIVGIYTDYSIAAVKKFLARSRFYSDKPILRERYCTWLRYSIMAHAARHSEPEKVLDYAAKHGSSFSEIAALFPIAETSEIMEVEKSAPRIYGVEYKAFKRFGYSLCGPDENKKQKFEKLFDVFISALRELFECNN